MEVWNGFVSVWVRTIEVVGTTPPSKIGEMVGVLSVVAAFFAVLFASLFILGKVSNAIRLRRRF